MRLSKIFEGIFVVIVDAIASGLSVEFVSKIKSLLCYEISLIIDLNLKEEMSFIFDGATIQSRLSKLIDIYLQALQDLTRPEGSETNE